MRALYRNKPIVILLQESLHNMFNQAVWHELTKPGVTRGLLKHSHCKDWC